MNQTFVNLRQRQNIKTIFIAENLTISMDNSLSNRTAIKFNVCLERMDSTNSFQIRITEINNYVHMYVFTIDNNAFEQIKTEQAINVSFTGFIDHLMNILDGCKKAELFISIVEKKGYKLMQFFEKRPVKNLVHLCLPLYHAKTEEILFHINQELESVRNKLIASKAQIETQVLELSTKDRVIEQQKVEINSLNQKLSEQEHQLMERTNKEIKRFQMTIKQMQETNDFTDKKHRHELRSYQDKIDVMSREASISNENYVQATKREESLIQEMNRLNSIILSMKDDSQQLQRDLDQYKSRKNNLCKKISDLKNQYDESQENLQSHQKRIQELLAELEAEKNIAHTKRNALQIATEEISSANRIIMKQAKEIEKLKSKIDIRTEVALQQEKVMEQKDKENFNLNASLLKIKKEYDLAEGNKIKYLETIENVQDSIVTLNEKYKNKIKELHLEIDHAVMLKRK